MDKLELSKRGAALCLCLRDLCDGLAHVSVVSKRFSARPSTSPGSCITKTFIFKIHVSHFPVDHCREHVVVFAKMIRPKNSFKEPQSANFYFKFYCSRLKKWIPS